MKIQKCCAGGRVTAFDGESPANRGSRVESLETHRGERRKERRRD
ncbi:hypothetical protein [Trichloromonas sp.]